MVLNICIHSGQGRTWTPKAKAPDLQSGPLPITVYLPVNHNAPQKLLFLNPVYIWLNVATWKYGYCYDCAQDRTRTCDFHLVRVTLWTNWVTWAKKISYCLSWVMFHTLNLIAKAPLLCFIQCFCVCRNLTFLTNLNWRLHLTIYNLIVF